MANEVNSYLKTRRGLKALCLFCNGLSVAEAVRKAPSLGFVSGGIRTTLGENCAAFDTLMDMYLG